MDSRLSIDVCPLSSLYLSFIDILLMRGKQLCSSCLAFQVVSKTKDFVSITLHRRAIVAGDSGIVFHNKIIFYIDLH